MQPEVIVALIASLTSLAGTARCARHAKVILKLRTRIVEMEANTLVIARLRARVAELEGQLAQFKQAFPTVVKKENHD